MLKEKMTKKTLALGLVSGTTIFVDSILLAPELQRTDAKNIVSKTLVTLNSLTGGDSFVNLNEQAKYIPVDMIEHIEFPYPNLWRHSISIPSMPTEPTEFKVVNQHAAFGPVIKAPVNTDDPNKLKHYIFSGGDFLMLRTTEDTFTSIAWRHVESFTLITS